MQKLTEIKERLKNLYQKLENREINADVEGILLRLVTAIKDGNTQLADTTHTILSGSNWDMIGSTNMVGLKRCIALRKSFK